MKLYDVFLVSVGICIGLIIISFTVVLDDKLIGKGSSKLLFETNGTRVYFYNNGMRSVYLAENSNSVSITR